MGRLTADPELRQTQSGINTCRFTVAVNRNTSQNGEQQSDFITVQAWRERAEFVSRYFSKGRLIIVEGNLQTGSYTDRNHPDVTHFTTTVIAENVSFGETKTAVTGGGQGYNSPPQNNHPQSAPPQASSNLGLEDFTEVISDGDLPF